ncbi:GNAT family N-acetyltransferase [Enterovibrio norvegicus FF-33]|uniref:GNAT family N-acetyltransferase n=1 Tax=Enterovibrio norvegicus FF-454 TaxID=1185651 RepID=A0A1E5CBJ3_9GAMM|nr:GNAT family N-acetyltransferase [Enterovibrio norvegicus]OEE62876.1 GNAT family N-acetyltransferase [Enterovibrio norvegicus FF-454]OEE66800.1 GNAT family N-acetyltransferase [Enterovibrio norvegicus FF-33]OEE76563.1 GNAT family N-acetyltransferase [Enterovibrio norvegicus FF-162]
MITVRKMRAGEEMMLWQLFYKTIRQINIRDYTPEQVAVWAPDECNEAAWCDRMQRIQPFVAIINDKIAGYAGLRSDGYIDHFFVDADFQSKSVGKTLMKTLFREGKKNSELSRYFSHVSITAKPFYERMGFHVVKVQQIEKQGQVFTNYVMEKAV